MNTHWNNDQECLLVGLMSRAERGEVWLGYWCSDAHGLPCNGGRASMPVSPGEVQDTGFVAPPVARYPGVAWDPPWEPPCTNRVYHATRDPLSYAGSRVWIVALHAPWFSGGGDEAWAYRRTIVGDILPSEACFDASVAAKLGGKTLDSRIYTEW